MVHAVLVRGVTQCLKEIFDGGFYADKVLERIFKNNRKWGSRDRRFVAETVYNMTRWWSYLVSLSGGAFVPKTQEDYITLWAIYETWRNKNDVGEFLQKSFSLKFDQTKYLKKLGEKRESYIEVAFPQWLYKRFEVNFGVETLGILKSLNESAPVCLRANGLKTERGRLQKLLQNENVLTKLGESPDTLILETRQNVFSTDSFKSGLFEVQDQASQKVSILLDPKPGERIADMCAGAGGKTLHLAALMNNKGSLFASDVSERKLVELKKRAKRAGVSNLRIQIIDNSKTLKRLSRSFDGVLIDAPCSGSGVIRRNPDSKWKLSEDELMRLKKLQSEILESYSKLVKPGGRLVYATCSLLGEENMGQIDLFLQGHPEFSKEGNPLLTRPDIQNEDGFFAQKLRHK